MNRQTLLSRLTLLSLLFSLNVFAELDKDDILLDRIVAVVNDEVIMSSTLEQEVRTISERLRQQDKRLPPLAILDKQVLERIIIQQLQLQRAERSGIRIEDQRLNAAVSRIAERNNLSIRQFRHALEAENYDFSTYRENIRQEMLIQRLRERQVEERIHVTQSEIDNWIETYKRQGQGGSEYHLQHILIGIPEQADPDTITQKQDQAQQILSLLQKGDDFSETAIAVSDSRQALEGGDLGWRKEGELPTLFKSSLAAMQTGQLSKVLRNASGFHIIKLVDKRDTAKIIVTQTQARHILLKPSEILSVQDAQTRLGQIRSRILVGEDFATLAQAHSADKSSSAKGGDLGWVTPGSLVPEFEKVMNDLGDNDISQVFKTRYGWHIIQVLARRQHDNTREAIRAKAVAEIRARKTDEALESWLRRLRDEAYVEYR